MGPAVFLYVLKLIDDKGDPLKSAQVKRLAPFWFSSQPSETATRSAPGHTD